MTRYICKRCGAESPIGIGYVGLGDGPLPEPDPYCPNPHAKESPRASARRSDHGPDHDPRG